jgi:uncharacterized membrane protein
MTTFLLRLAAGAVSFMALDGLWLGFVMNGFYKNHLAPIARMAGGSFTPNWPAALAVYLLLGAGIASFAAPRATGPASAAGYGALLGLVVYGVYDFTNFSTLKDYPIALALADLAWGVTASAIGSVAVRAAVR